MNQLQNQQTTPSPSQPEISPSFSESEYRIEFDNKARIVELAGSSASPTPEPSKPELTQLNEAFAEEFARYNQDIMSFADEHYFKGEPPATFERGMIVSGAKALARRMSAPVQERFAIGAFFMGWGMYLIPRIINVIAKQKQEKELREKAGSEEAFQRALEAKQRLEEESKNRKVIERAEQAKQIKKEAAERRKAARVKAQ